MFLPHRPWEVTITRDDIHKAVQRMKPRAPGPDGWTVEEIKLLPAQAWRDVMQHLFREEPRNPFTTSLLGWFRRVPIPKSDTANTPGAIRLIDIFSVVLRAVTAAQAQSLKPMGEAGCAP